MTPVLRRWARVALLLGLLLSSVPAANASHQIGPSMWGPTSVMYAERFRPAATRLPDGRAFVVGGTTRLEFEPGRFRWEPQRSAEIYDPTSISWTRVADAPVAIGEGARAFTLADGRVFIWAGGRYVNIYDPATDAWEQVGPTLAVHFYATVAHLRDGRVLLIGTTLNSTKVGEIFDPVSETFTPAAAATRHLEGPSVTLLNGEVLWTGCTDPSVGVRTADIYNPLTNVWRPTTPLQRRCAPSATLMADGSVLVAGGNDFTTTLSSAEVYDVGRGRWSAVPSMIAPRRAHSAGPLPDGSVFVVGGGPSRMAERFFPQTGKWLEVDRLERERRDPSVVLLGQGQMLVIGGQDGGTYNNSAVIFESLKSRLGTLTVQPFHRNRRHEARFTDAGTGAGVPGAQLRFQGDGIDICDAVTDTNGWARCPTDINTVLGAAAGANIYRVEFPGDERYRDIACFSDFPYPPQPDPDDVQLDWLYQTGDCTSRASYN